MEVEQIIEEIAPKKSRRRKKLLYSKIKEQMEFYFSDVNLGKDRFIKQLIQKDPYIDLSVFLQFNKIRNLTNKVSDLCKAVAKSELLELSEDNLKVCRKTSICVKENEDECTIYVERLPVGVEHDWLKNIFSQFGPVDYVSIPRYTHNRKIKGFAFIEFDAPESARKALEYFESIDCKLPTTMLPDQLASISSFEPKKSEKNQNISNQFSTENIKEEMIKNEEESEFRDSETKLKRKRQNEKEIYDGIETNEIKKIKNELSDQETEDLKTDEIKKIKIELSDQEPETMEYKEVKKTEEIKTEEMKIELSDPKTETTQDKEIKETEKLKIDETKKKKKTRDKDNKQTNETMETDAMEISKVKEEKETEEFETDEVRKKKKEKQKRENDNEQTNETVETDALKISDVKNEEETEEYKTDEVRKKKKEKQKRDNDNKQTNETVETDAMETNESEKDTEILKTEPENNNKEEETKEQVECKFDNESGEKRKRKRKKSKYNVNDLQQYGLQVLSKKEWKQLRNKYLNLQRQKMQFLKEQLYKSRFTNVQNNSENNPTLKNTEEKNSNTKSTARFEFTPGAIVYIMFSDAFTDLKKFKNDIRSQPGIQYIDVKLDSKIGFIRFSDNSSAKKFCESEYTNVSKSILEGNEEKDYWDTILHCREEKFKKDSNKKHRGRDKLVRKAEKELGKHIRFDAE